MIVGFTGTRNEIPDTQAIEMQKQLDGLNPEEVHHGDCVGADATFHRSCFVAKIPRIVIHPPDSKNHRANCDFPWDIPVVYDYSSDPVWAYHDDFETVIGWHMPQSYLDRNKAIVDACHVLIACPNSKEEQQRSGTWSTVRYARRQGKKIIFVFPDGSTKLEDN